MEVCNTKTIENHDEKFNEWLKAKYNKTWNEIYNEVKAGLLKDGLSLSFLKNEKQEYLEEFYNECM